MDAVTYGQPTIDGAAAAGMTLTPADPFDRKVQMTLPFEEEMKNSLTSLHANWQISDQWSLTSVTGYQENHDEFGGDDPVGGYNASNGPVTWLPCVRYADDPLHDRGTAPRLLGRPAQLDVRRVLRRLPGAAVSRRLRLSFPNSTSRSRNTSRPTNRPGRSSLTTRSNSPTSGSSCSAHGIPRKGRGLEPVSWGAAHIPGSRSTSAASGVRPTKTHGAARSRCSGT